MKEIKKAFCENSRTMQYYHIEEIELQQTIKGKKYTYIGKVAKCNHCGDELTFSRYYKGDIPSKRYSDILKRIIIDPIYFNQILEENKIN